METPNAKLAKFGASSFEYGVLDENDKITDTRKVSGLSEVKVELTNDLKTLAADDGPYLVLSGGINQAKETLNLYDVDSTMKHDLYGVDVTNGIEKYTKDFTPNYVATLFRTKLSNGKHVWVGYLKGCLLYLEFLVRLKMVHQIQKQMKLKVTLSHVAMPILEQSC